MRKTNVFGKKINPSKPLYWLIFVFFVALLSYLSLLYISNIKTADLQQQQIELQQSINQLLIEEQNTDYNSIEELLPYLPNEFTQSIVYNELILIKDISGLNDAVNYVTTFDIDAENPFEVNYGSSLNYVKISISMNISDYNNIFDYINNLTSFDRLYYVEKMNLSILNNGSATVDIDIFTFYMD